MQTGIITEITQDVKWIGIQDSGLRNFDIIMETKYGTSYNSYFINATKKTIIETAKETFSKEYLEKVHAVVDPVEIEYIVLDHTEPDHSGSLKHLLKIAPNATVVGSGNAIRYLADIVGFNFKNKVVKDGDTLSLGNKTLQFIGAPNLHWPDTIYTYLEEDKLLFTCDSFGAHYSDDRLFDDLVGNFDEAFKYYFDVILRPFSKFMLKAIDKIKDLEIKMICPGHGPILRKNWKKYVDISAEYARQELELRSFAANRVLVCYVSAYGYTKEMAEKISEGIRSVSSREIELFDIESTDFHWLNEKITTTSALIIGSPTINQNILPQIYSLFSAINPIRDRGKQYAAFGSYGWSGEGVDIIENAMNTLKLKKITESLKIKFYPDQKVYEQLFNFGKTIAKNLIVIEAD